MSWLVRAVAKVLWIYGFFTMALLLAVAAFPGVVMVVTTWDKFGFVPDPFPYFFRTFMVVSGYFVTGITMMFLLPVMRKMIGGSKEGRVPIRSFRVWSWYNIQGMTLMWQTLFGRFWRSSALYVLFLKSMGAKIGKNVIVNSNTVYDLDLIEIGDNTVIGGDAAIIGHVGEKGHLVREKIRIGKGCTVGQYTTVFPGATLGDNCHVGAMSLVPKGATLDANSVYGGVPVKKIKDLKPGATSSIVQASEPEALAIELARED